MRRLAGGIFPIAILLAFIQPTDLNAWEIQLKSRTSVPSAVIRLNDIATVTGVEEPTRSALQQIVIAPTPTRSYSRSITASQLRRILTQYGVDLTDCRFVGQARVVVQRPSPNRQEPRVQTVSHAVEAAIRPTARARHNPEQLKQELIGAILRQISAEGELAESWQVDVSLARRTLWNLPGNWQDVQIEGLNPPWDGPHDITVRFASDQQIARVPLRIRIARKEQQVVATRPLARGHIVGPRDVELCAVPSSRRSAGAARSLEDVIGCEVKGNIETGQTIPITGVVRPLLVQRREIVDVVAKTGAITIRRRARALQDGAKGDIVMLQDLDQKNDHFTAYVAGRRLAQAFVGPTIVENSSPEPRR